MIQIPTYFIPGNHDLWSDGSDKSSTEILEFYKTQEECLIGRPLIVNDGGPSLVIQVGMIIVLQISDFH